MVIFIVNHKIKDEYCLSKWLCLLCIQYVGLRLPGVIYRHLVRIWSWSIIENAVSLTLVQFHLLWISFTHFGSGLFTLDQVCSLWISFTHFRSVSLTLVHFHLLWISFTHFGSGLLTLDAFGSLWIRFAHFGWFGSLWMHLALCVSVLFTLDQFGLF